ncbi:MAG: hypothetical protein IKN41_07635 [Candidatus Methanomethylophilaceae archaeon]|nr:hypothetical protein [Candidatus Methanomethylophilaceae archaeon]
MAENSIKTTLPINEALDHRKNVWKEPHSFEELPEDVKRMLVSRRRRAEPEEKKTLEILESKYVMQLLVYLNSMSPVTKSDIYNDVARNPNMPNKIQELYVLGLLDIFYTGRTNTNVIIITEKGRRVADRIMQLVELIEGTYETDSFI